MTRSNQLSLLHSKGAKQLIVLFVLVLLTMAYKDIKKGFAAGFGSLQQTTKASLHSSFEKQTETIEFNHLFMFSEIY